MPQPVSVPVTKHLATRPANKRVLHVEVPEEIFNGAKAKSLLLGVRWPEFVIELLRTAHPNYIGQTDSK